MRIVTWNVYWLQGAGYADWRPGPPREHVLSGIAGLLDELGGDLVCIQELQSFDAARALAEATGADWWFYRPGGSADRPQYGGAVLARGEAWTFAPVADARIERVAIKAVRPADSACLANVHLRSNRFQTSEAAAAARGDELLAVLDSEPRPHVVAGDFNAKLDAGLWDLLRQRGYFDAADRAGCRDAPTALGGGCGDRIWVHADLADRFLAARVLAADRTALPDGEHLSDHLPMVMEMDL